MNEPNDPAWLSWVAPVLMVLAAAWALLRWLFVATIKAEVAAMHAQNQERFSDIEKSLSRIEGRLQDKWGE